MSIVDAKEITILRLGAEGGHLDLVGAADQSGWRFQIHTDENTLLDLLTEEDAAELSPTTAGRWVHSWHEVLDQLETRYPYWRSLLPLQVEPAFRAAIIAAFLRLKHDDTNRLQNILVRWADALLDIQPSSGRNVGSE
jgi:hypothetical protein